MIGRRSPDNKVFVTEDASSEQREAFGALVHHLLPFVAKGSAPSIEPAALTVAREGASVSYDAPNTSVKLDRVHNASGAPIRLENLPVAGSPFPAAHDHVQYKSQVLAHDGGDETFEWTGRNGFTSTIAISGALADE